MAKRILFIISVYFLATALNCWGEDAGAGQPKLLNLDLKSLAQMVKGKNERMFIQQLEWRIRNEAVKSAKSVFEPELRTAYTRMETKEKSLAKDQDIKSQSLFSGGSLEKITTSQETRNKAELAVEQRLITGASVKLAGAYDIIDDLYSAGYDEDKTFFGATVKQPLLKDFGTATTMAAIHIAETDADMEFQSYRLQLMRTEYEALAAYWDYYLNQEKMKIREDSIKIAEQILVENRERVKAGKMAETEVMEAEAGLAIRRSLASAARQALIAARNNLFIYISSTPGAENAEITTVEAPNTVLEHVSFDGSMETATQLKPEYLTVQKKMEQADLRIAYMKNQKWPQLDLNASYGVNGLGKAFDTSFDDAFKNQFPAWSLGLEFSIPLGAGMKARSELEAAKHRKRQALHELKAIENMVFNVIDAAVKGVALAHEQTIYYADAERLRKQLFDVELLRLAGGKSTSKVVFDREEELIKAKEANLESLATYQKSLLSLSMAEGSLLDRYKVEPEKVETDL